VGGGGGGGGGSTGHTTFSFMTCPRGVVLIYMRVGGTDFK
jgi:hypothetical protein